MVATARPPPSRRLRGAAATTAVAGRAGSVATPPGGVSRPAPLPKGCTAASPTRGGRSGGGTHRAYVCTVQCIGGAADWWSGRAAGPPPWPRGCTAPGVALPAGNRLHRAGGTLWRGDSPVTTPHALRGPAASWLQLEPLVRLAAAGCSCSSLWGPSSRASARAHTSAERPAACAPLCGAPASPGGSGGGRLEISGPTNHRAGRQGSCRRGPAAGRPRPAAAGGRAVDLHLGRGRTALRHWGALLPLRWRARGGLAAGHCAHT